jgi:hypothetical protein
MDRGDHYPAFPFCIASALSARSFDGNWRAAGKVENTEEVLAEAREEIPRWLAPPTYLRSVCTGNAVEAFAHVVEAGRIALLEASITQDPRRLVDPPCYCPRSVGLPSPGHLPRDTRHQHAAL